MDEYEYETDRAQPPTISRRTAGALFLEIVLLLVIALLTMGG